MASNKTHEKKTKCEVSVPSSVFTWNNIIFNIANLQSLWPFVRIKEQESGRNLDGQGLLFLVARLPRAFEDVAPLSGG